ncbi:MAG: bifunctional glutamate N-acetyltransferase/amino-acid acetyltransferase ArgJ [Anaerolineaceae bacterium]|nr:bifunctional glutamate N-acetyltransferase/amino-acid acetyltransferase ArgJ [Anaerolineaceae bacterium]
MDFVPGFRVAGVAAGLKKNDALDMTLIVSDTPCVAAGVFTTNYVKAAPVLFDMEVLQGNKDHIRAVTINTKCANACTGDQGLVNAREMARQTAEKIGCGLDEVLVMSTGVIGSQLPMEKIGHGIDLAAGSLGSDWAVAAAGIMTTDTRPKMAAVAVTASNGKTYHIAGIAKGAGMIAPNMATMLSVIVTDVTLPIDTAKGLLQSASETTFNRVVVDGDMSTNDTLLLLANGVSGVTLQSPDDFTAFHEALAAVCRKLAQDIVRDGEGVTKFITLTVRGAASPEVAHQIANTIATSPLVKTAFFGNDANWGRIVAAAGRAGVPIDPDLVRLWIAPGETEDFNLGSLLLFTNGMPSGYGEEQATAIFKESSVSILLDLGMGLGSATVWTCDLSHDYVSINGDYRS